MEKVIKEYDELLKKVEKITILNSVGSLISWDMETKMPPKGIELRSQQLALLKQIGHKMITNPVIGSHLKKLEKSPKYPKFNQVQKRNIHLIRKTFNEQAALPETLVVKTAKQSAITTDIWKKAKAKSDFSKFKPDLKKLIDLRKEAAEVLMDVKDTKTPYDALIDIFEPGMTQDSISKVFDEMRNRLTKLVDKILDQDFSVNSIIKRNIPVNIQKKISMSLLNFIEYDLDRGRLDETEHPFTTGYYDDVRITTHYHEKRYPSSIFSVLHEGGHALYEQNLPKKWRYTPIGTSCSMGIHEAMSRFIENMIGRSPEFWEYFLPKLKKLTDGLLDDISFENYIAGINKVEPSLIRIEADEVTYGLHIIIRFEIERDILSDEISVNELPEVWNNKYQKYLGVEVPNDAVGVMQDTHWASGLIGYFPSYALGNIYGGQILKKMTNEIKDWKENVINGNFIQIKNWLKNNIYSYGNLYDPENFIKLITGKSLNIDPFLTYLYSKMSEIYAY